MFWRESHLKSQTRVFTAQSVVIHSEPRLLYLFWHSIASQTLAFRCTASRIERVNTRTVTLRTTPLALALRAIQVTPSI